MKSVILYGAGYDAGWGEEGGNMEKFDYLCSFVREKLQGEVVCFADSDIDKQGKCLHGLNIFSLTDAINQYPDYALLPTLSYEKMEDVSEYLMKNGIPRDRIIYSDRIEKRKGCFYLEKKPWITLSGLRVKVVSECTGELAIERSGELMKDLERIETARLLCRKSVINGKSCVCDNCFVNMEDFYPLEINPQFDIAIIFESNYYDTVCNARCCYCTATDNRRYLLDNDMLKRGRRFLDDWREIVRIYSNKKLYIAFGNGEFTVSPWRDEVFRDLSKLTNWHILVPSNGLIYDERLAQLVADGRAELLISIDAGTPDTFARVKGVSRLDKVIANIRNYLNIASVTKMSNKIAIKYLVLEGVNDSEDDLDGFVAIATELGCTVVISNDNFTLPNPMTKTVTDTMKYLVAKLRDTNVIHFGRHCFLASDYKSLRHLQWSKKWSFQ